MGQSYTENNSDLKLDQIITATKEPTGYTNRTDTTFSFDDGTRTFTIEPVGASYDYWTQGVQHTITTPKIIVLPDITEKYFVYFDALETLGYTIVFDSDLLNDKVLTVVIYYNATTGKGEFLLDERHGLTMDWATHFHLHNAFGTRYYGGFGLAYTIGSGAVDSDAQIALGTGTIADEDIPTTIVDKPTPNAFFEQVLSPIALVPVAYQLGSAEWQKDTATNYPIKIVSGIPQYNLDTLGTLTLEDVTNGNYFVSWIFAINEINTPIISIIGSRQDTSLADAQNNNTYGTIDWGDLPSQEYKILYRLIYKYDTSYSNSVKIALVDADDLRGAVDSVLTSSVLIPVATHGNLIGLGADDHLQYYNQTRGDARYVQKNASITGATKTKITYDSKGLVTSGADATTADIAPSTDRNYVTDAKLVVVNNTTNTNTGDETTLSIQTKRPLKTINGNSLEGSGNIDIVSNQYYSKRLTAIQSTSGLALISLNNLSFEIPAGQSATFWGVLIFTSAANNTGVNYGIKVLQPTGANGNAAGSYFATVNVNSSPAATALNDGDVINVAQNSNTSYTILGTGSSAGNNAAHFTANITNLATNESTFVSFVYASEVNGTSVSAQINSTASAIIGITQ